MKNFLKIFAITGFIALSLSACPSPNSSSSSNPTASPSNGTNTGTNTGGSGIFASRTTFLAYLNCIKTNNPKLGPQMEVHFTNLNNFTDEQFLSVLDSYKNLSDNYSAFGCK